MEITEVKEFVKKYPAIHSWLHNIQGDILLPCRLVHYARGKSLFRRGDEVKKVYLICAGEVIITNSSLKGTEMCVVGVPEGASVGEMEAMLGVPELVYSAKTLTDSSLLEIPLWAFKRWISTDLQACRQLATELARKLHTSSVAAVHYHSLPALTRFKIYLVDCGEGKIQDTREKLAEICGVSVRTINRVIVELKNENLLHLEKGKLILEEEQIKRIAESLENEI